MGPRHVLRGAAAALGAYAALSFGYAQECAPPDVPPRTQVYRLSGEARERDPDLEHRLIHEEEKLPADYVWYLNTKHPDGALVVSFAVPSRTPELVRLDPDRPTTAGGRVEDAAAFVLPESNLGYYNPERVARGTVSVNAYLHELGHMVYHMIDMENQTSLGSFRRASVDLRAWLADYYPRGSRSDEEYERILDGEAFAEAFAMFYSHDHSRFELDRYHESLFDYMIRLDSAVERAVEASLAADYAPTCPEPDRTPARASSEE